MSRSVFDRLVEDKDFYVQVQKTKIKLLVVLLILAGLAHWPW
ncbi:hypothetical protein [Ralstonia phage RP12]|uniref:Uncharacterized protein n=1 Tax=Ralstonia phage RP12 TaxID=1923889 RepID=A0A1L7N0U8_9CAUD|nr:hypothetical protein FDH28_gp128 [Ralstonia phage RP12]BAW19102.1 hypothetical protein [Ralstonia phage RP12]